MSGIHLSKHCFVIMFTSFSAISNQIPCLGVYCISNFLAILLASEGRNDYKDAVLCVFKLLIT